VRIWNFRRDSLKHEIAISIEPTSENNRRYIRGVLEYVALQSDLTVYKNLAIPFLHPDQALKWKGAGLITGAETEAYIKRLLKRPFPVVSVSLHRKPDNTLPVVGSDNLAIGQLMAEHLMETGLKQFAFVGNFQWYHSRLRWEGFSKTLMEAGLESAQIAVKIIGKSKPSASTAYFNFGHYDNHDLEREFAKLTTPIGVAVSHDEFADAVIEVCRQNNIRVPYDVAVVGCNDYHLLCESCDPPLSSVPQSAERIGFEAAQLLHRLINGESPPKTPLLIQPQPVVARRSSDFLAIDDPDVLEAVQFIRRRFQEKLTTQLIADKVSVGRKTLDQRFVKSLGHPVAEEIRLTRLRRAKVLLSTTDMQVVSIGLHCGYSSTSGFVRAFREATGQTPIKYRRQNEKKP